MSRHWRFLGAVFIVVAAHAGFASAQTVIVTNAKEGTPVQVEWGAAKAEPSTVDAMGIARATLDAAALGTRVEAPVRLSLDECGTTLRVVLVDRDAPVPAPEAGCRRQDAVGVFAVQRVTTLVVDVRGGMPSVLIRQGPPPAAWLRQGDLLAPGPAFALPRGFFLSGGGGFVSVHDAVNTFCGDVTNCSGGAFRPALAASAGVWVTGFLGAQVGYFSLRETTVNGTADTYRFESALDADVFTVMANAGGSSGRARIYGQAGANFHRGSARTTQTGDGVIDAAGQVIPGLTQTITFETDGWGWIFGGGAEVWMNRRLGIFIEGGFAQLKGTDLSGGEAATDTRIGHASAGIRVSVGP